MSLLRLEMSLLRLEMSLLRPGPVAEPAEGWNDC